MAVGGKIWLEGSCEMEGDDVEVLTDLLHFDKYRKPNGVM